MECVIDDWRDFLVVYGDLQLPVPPIRSEDLPRGLTSLCFSLEKEHTRQCLLDVFAAERFWQHAPCWGFVVRVEGKDERGVLVLLP